MREDQRGIQFHPATEPLVSLSLFFDSPRPRSLTLSLSLSRMLFVFLSPPPPPNSPFPVFSSIHPFRLAFAFLEDPRLLTPMLASAVFCPSFLAFPLSSRCSLFRGCFRTHPVDAVARRSLRSLLSERGKLELFAYDVLSSPGS